MKLFCKSFGSIYHFEFLSSIFITFCNFCSKRKFLSTIFDSINDDSEYFTTIRIVKLFKVIEESNWNREL